jgi:Lon protease-like protein
VDLSAFDAGSFSGIVPLFPLPTVVLFPHSILPLHIFEPRYRAMTAEAIAGERLISMALLKPGWEQNYYGNPSVHEVIGIGRVIEEEKTQDGRFNIVLYGVARARIVEEVRVEPFRAVRVDLLEERPAGGKKYERLRKMLLSFYAQILKGALKGVNPAPPGDLPLGPLCDLLASIITFDASLKQAMLEELDVGARCDLLVGYLENLNAPGIRLPGDPSSRAPWPPEASSN